VPEEAHEPIPLSIIALDDDEDFLQYIRSILESEGHDVRTFSTPRPSTNRSRPTCPMWCCSTSRWAAAAVKKSSPKSASAGTAYASSS